MKAGNYKYKIKIYQPTVIIDEYGEQTKDYLFERDTKASVIWNKGEKQSTGGELFIGNVFDIVVHSYINIQDDTRIEFQGKMYEIISHHKDLRYNDKILSVREINV